jgi:hypothetical protein
MTGNNDLISRRNCIYVIYSGSGNHTAHSNDKLVKMPHLDELLIMIRLQKPQFLMSIKRGMVNDWQ